MKKPIYLALILMMSLTGCLHHKRKHDKPLKSRERQVHPEIQKYHQEKKEREAIKVVEIPLPQEEKKEESRQEIINMGPGPQDESQEDKKKPESSWWSWE